MLVVCRFTRPPRARFCWAAWRLLGSRRRGRATRWAWCYPVDRARSPHCEPPGPTARIVGARAGKARKSAAGVGMPLAGVARGVQALAPGGRHGAAPGRQQPRPAAATRKGGTALMRSSMLGHGHASADRAVNALQLSSSRFSTMARSLAYLAVAAAALSLVAPASAFQCPADPFSCTMKDAEGAAAAVRGPARRRAAPCRRSPPHRAPT